MLYVLDEIIISLHTYVFLRLEKVIIPNYNTHKLLTFTKKKKKKRITSQRLVIHYEVVVNVGH